MERAQIQSVLRAGAIGHSYCLLLATLALGLACGSIHVVWIGLSGGGMHMMMQALPVWGYRLIWHCVIALFFLHWWRERHALDSLGDMRRLLPQYAVWSLAGYALFMLISWMTIGFPLTQSIGSLRQVSDATDALSQGVNCASVLFVLLGVHWLVWGMWWQWRNHKINLKALTAGEYLQSASIILMLALLWRIVFKGILWIDEVVAFTWLALIFILLKNNRESMGLVPGYRLMQWMIGGGLLAYLLLLLLPLFFWAVVQYKVPYEALLWLLPSCLLSALFAALLPLWWVLRRSPSLAPASVTAAGGDPVDSRHAALLFMLLVLAWSPALLSMLPYEQLMPDVLGAAGISAGSLVMGGVAYWMARIGLPDTIASIGSRHLIRSNIMLLLLWQMTVLSIKGFILAQTGASVDMPRSVLGADLLVCLIGIEIVLFCVFCYVSVKHSPAFLRDLSPASKPVQQQ